MKYLILAGGSGTRLWPLSRKKFAKQFINFNNEYSLLQNTALRVSRENGRDIYVIAGFDSKFIVEEQLLDILPDFEKKHFILEPVGRNTAPAIAYSTNFFDEDDIIAVLSSDQYVDNDDEFLNTLTKAEKIAKEGYIVTIGIVPDVPKTGYGYIKVGDKKLFDGYHVDKFVEKPNVEKAKEYLKDGNYFWNAGIFVFKVKTFLEELKKHSPELFQTNEKFKAKLLKNEKITKDIFTEFQNISIDYALMEKSDKIALVPSSFVWSDIGSFGSLFEILPKNESGSIVRADNYIDEGSSNLLVFGDKRKIATLGVKNLIIVDTADATLVADIDRSEDIKSIVKRLEESDPKVVDSNNVTFRPWGSYTILDEGKNYKVKQLCINPNSKISLQFHKHRSETWTIAEGVAEITIGNEVRTLYPSESIFIPSNTNHRLFNPLHHQHLKVIEVQTGPYLEEDDIIRLEDDYERE